MDHAETLAQLLIERILEGSTMHFHEDQSHGECDFDLQRGGSHFALEVTAAVNRPIEELYGAIISSKKGGPIVHAMKTWTPTISLRNLETGDVRRFSTFS